MAISIEFGPCVVLGGGRNRARRLRRAQRWGVRCAPAVAKPREPRVIAPPVNLAGQWTPEIAKVALRKLEASGLSQAAFAAANGFPASRIPAWRKRLTATA